MTLLLVALGGSVASCWAEVSGLPEAVTIEQLLQILREKSPKLAAERTQIDIAAAGVVEADILPNPTVRYGRNDPLGGKSTAQFEGSQEQQSTVDIPLLVAGQRAVRREAAERGVTAAQAQVQARYAELARQAWELFVKLLASQEKVHVLEETHGHLGRIKDIVSGRARVGAASQYDVLRITVEAAALDTRLADARTEVIDSSGEISALMGLPGWRPQAVGRLAPLGVEISTDTLWEKAEQRNPSLEAARKQELAAEAGIARAKRERWPVPVVSLGTVWTNNPYSLTSFAGLSVEIPLFDRKQGIIAKALAEKQSAMLSLTSVTAETHAELERAVAQLTSKRKTLSSFEREALSQLPTLERMAEDAYRLGKGSLLELLDSTRSRNELKLNHLDLIEAVAKAEIDTLAAAGFLFDKIHSLP